MKDSITVISARLRPVPLVLALLAASTACAPATRLPETATPIPRATEEAAATPAPTPVAVAVASTTLTFAAAGDVTLGSHFEEWFDEQVKSKTRTKDEQFRFAFDKVRGYLADADVAFVNQEGTLSDRGTAAIKQFTFRARPELVKVLLDGGIDVAALANNHAYDFGEDALLDTIATLTSAGILQVGAGRNGIETRTPAILSKNGIKVGLLGYVAIGKYDHLQKPTGWKYDTTRPGVAACVGDYACLKAMVIEDVTKTAQLVDAPIVSFHWGVEGNHEPEPYQIDLAHAAIDAGAKLVIGHHPHVLQGLEVYNGGVIAYSLGNFIFGGNWSPKDKDSAILRVTLAKQGVVSAAIVPLKHSNPPDAYFQPYVLTGEEATRLLTDLAVYSWKFPATLGFFAPYREAAAARIAAAEAEKAKTEAGKAKKDGKGKKPKSKPKPATTDAAPEEKPAPSGSAGQR